MRTTPIHSEYDVELATESQPITVLRTAPVPVGHHVAADAEEMILAERALLNDPEFREVIAKLQLPSNATVVADAWIYGKSWRGL